jgi:hypothetical protein
MTALIFVRSKTSDLMPKRHEQNLGGGNPGQLFDRRPARYHHFLYVLRRWLRLPCHE